LINIRCFSSSNRLNPSTFSGSVEWETSTPAGSPGFADYFFSSGAVSASFKIDGTDYTSSILPNSFVGVEPVWSPLWRAFDAGTTADADAPPSEERNAGR
jgi:hypothetical protein